MSGLHLPGLTIGVSPLMPLPPAEELMPTELEQRQRAALAELRETLDTPRRQARFLCGIRSPRAGRARLYGHDAFGLLQHLSFSEVMSWLEHSA